MIKLFALALIRQKFISQTNHNGNSECLYLKLLTFDPTSRAPKTDSLI